MVDKKMYVTGGIGAIKQWEGFGIDYFLPQSTDEGGCYSETCASIAVLFLAERMLDIQLDGRYADVMELCLYNNIMTAMSIDGKSFTYVNQLGSSEKDKSGREDWFWCACCPPNFSRLFGSLGGYLWHFGEQDSEVFIHVHLYTSATLSFQSESRHIELEQKSEWPWVGNVSFELRNPEHAKINIKLRIPAWANSNFTLLPKTDSATITSGYLTLTSEYLAANPKFSLNISGFEPRFIEPHPYTNQRSIFLARGPIIYCAEDAQNSWETNHFKDVVIKPEEAIKEEVRCWEPTGETYVALHSIASKRSLKAWDSGSPGQSPASHTQTMGLEPARDIIFIPYYLRANSGGRGHMRVGLAKG